MKTLFLLCFISSFSILLSQSDSLKFEKIDSSTYVQIQSHYNEDGQLINTESTFFYQGLSDLAQDLFKNSELELRQIDDLNNHILQTQIQINEITRSCNKRKKYIADVLNLKYDSIAISNFQGIYIGKKWRLIIKDTVPENIEVDILSTSNTSRLRIREDTGGNNRSGTLKVIHRDKIEMSNFFNSEKIRFSRINQKTWKGKYNNLVYILKQL